MSLKIDSTDEGKNLFMNSFQGEFEDDDARREDIPTETEGPGTDQYDSKAPWDVFMGPATKQDFIMLQRDVYQRYGEHKELSQYYGKPCMQHSPLHLQATLSSDYPWEKMERSLCWAP